MRADLIVKGKSLTGSTDLTLLAPLKRGLVPSLESVSYKTRAQRLLRLLNGGRSSSHEFSLHRPISDSVERVARIHSVRVAVLEPEDKVLLAVTFDGTWEAYIRVLWQKVGTLLDAIFCNTEGYVLSLEGFEAWCGWVERVQVETGFFYNTHALTVGDVHYLREHERLHRSIADPEKASLEAVRMSTRTAEEIAYEVGQTTPAGALDTLRQGLQALALLFRLTDMFLPGTPDGDVLLRAARDLLTDFRPLVEDPDLLPEIARPVHLRFERQLDWLRADGRREVTTPREEPDLPEVRPTALDVSDVQGGMLAGYDDATHACLVLLAFDDARAASAFLAGLRPHLTTSEGARGTLFEGKGHGDATHPGNGRFYNVAFTLEGLRRFGLTEHELEAWLPPEFREGMEARASMLGDFRANHPRRWALPRTNWRRPADSEPMAVQMSAVHLVVQIRAALDPAMTIDDPEHPDYPLRCAIEAIVDLPGGQPRPGVRVLSVQTMRRQWKDKERQVTIEHFGFADGKGQPAFTGPNDPRYENQTQLGEVLLGHPNAADPAPVAYTEADQARLDFLRNGSFMVVRKLRQDVPRLRDTVRAAEAQLQLGRRYLLAKMMGRWQGGASTLRFPSEESPPPDAETDMMFTFEEDPKGSKCPFHAHLRRVNPRETHPRRGEGPGRRPPRILRRGMAYGPRAAVLPGDPDDDGSARPGDDADRGLMFIAYNASIAEQFEVVQSWITGGNSTRGLSSHSDPFLGVPEPGEQRYFRFETESSDGHAQAVSIPLDSGPEPFAPPQPFVRLEWGTYLFVPAMHTLDLLQRRVASARPVASWCPHAGQARIAALERVRAEQGDDGARAAWKAAVEDPGAQEELRSASLWAAVRHHHGGALSTPYGVLVASRALVDEVLGDDRRFSVCGYRERMVASRFDIYLGLDHGERYEALSDGVNAAIGQIDRAQAFALAAGTTEAVLRHFISVEQAGAAQLGVPFWELDLDAKEVIDKVLQRLCQEWLGLPEHGGPLVPDGWRWDWTEKQPPIYPAHFTPPSRYFFQPHPGEDVRRYGERCAAALADALEAFVAPHRRAGTVPTVPGGDAPAPLARAILDSLPGEDDATVARTFAGVLMGFLPTLDGNLRLVLNEWQRLNTLWSLRAAWATDARPIGLAKAEALLEAELVRAMQFRPSPELIWRTAVRETDRIGKVALSRGDVVVVGLVSATHEALAQGVADVMPVFGGTRGPTPVPTHACPGYAAAMGTMLGVLAAFVDVRETMRPNPAPLAFNFQGPTR